MSESQQNLAIGENISQRNRTFKIGRLQFGGGGLALMVSAVLAAGLGAGVAGKTIYDGATAKGLAAVAKGSWECKTSGDGPMTQELESFTLVIGDNVWKLTPHGDTDATASQDSGTWKLEGNHLEVEARGVRYVLDEMPSAPDEVGTRPVRFSRQSRTDPAVEFGPTQNLSLTAVFRDDVLRLTTGTYVFECAKKQ